MRIVYIGAKEQKGDNVGQTGLVWKRGEILEVADEKKALKLLEHPSVWADADKPYQVAPLLDVVKTVSKRIVVHSDVDTIARPVDRETFAELKSGKLEIQFISPAQWVAFCEWEKLEAETKPAETKPAEEPKSEPKGLEPSGKKKAA